MASIPAFREQIVLRAWRAVLGPQSGIEVQPVGSSFINIPNQEHVASIFDPTDQRWGLPFDQFSPNIGPPDPRLSKYGFMPGQTEIDPKVWLQIEDIGSDSNQAFMVCNVEILVHHRMRNTLDNLWYPYEEMLVTQQELLLQSTWLSLDEVHSFIEESPPQCSEPEMENDILTYGVAFQARVEPD